MAGKEVSPSASQRNSFVLLQKDLPLKSFQTFASMRSNGDLCDVIFNLEGVKIAAHRLVLAANIPFFHAMFLNNTDKVNAGEIPLECVEPDAFESLIRFAYNCELRIDDDNAKSLLICASLLQMDYVLEACCEFILQRTRHSNALSAREFAIANDLMKLKEKIDEYVMNHFVEISHSEEFLELSFSDVKELLGNDEIRVTSEKEVYQAAMSWVKRRLPSREAKLPELLTVVRMPLLGCHYISSSVATEKLIQKSNSCMKLLCEAKDCCMLPPGDSSPCSFTMKCRTSACYQNPSSSKDFICAVCRLPDTVPYPTVVQRYDFSARKWQMMNAKTSYISGAAVVAVGKTLYVIGGCNRMGRFLNTVLVFDSELDTWDKMPSLGMKKTEVSAATFSDGIYVCGGRKGEYKVTNAVEYYSFENKRWTRFGSMLRLRSAACAVSLNDFIYVLGGRYFEKGRWYNLNSVERYDPKANLWSEISGMNSAQHLFGAVSLSNKIYTYGEYAIEVYDPWFQEWDQISTVNKGMRPISLLTFDGKLYAVGNLCSDKYGFPDSFPSYDPKTGEWNEEPSIPERLCCVGAGKITVQN